MGMTVRVYRDADGYDCSLNGVTARFDRLTLTNVEGPFEPTEDAPAAKLVYRSSLGGIVHVEPEGEEYEGKWLMFGGNYVATSDSRLSDAVEALLGRRFYGALAVHDRME